MLNNTVGSSIKNNQTKKLKVFLCLILIKILYDFICVNYIFDLMSISYSTNFRIIPIHYFTSFIIYSLVAFCMPLKIYETDKISSLVLMMLFVMFYLPTLSIYSYDNKLDIFYPVYISLYWFFILLFFFLMPSFSIKKKAVALDYRLIFSLTFIFCILFIYSFNGLNVNFDLGNVYEFRDNNSKLPIIIAWLKQGFNIIGPISIVYFFQTKRYLYLILAIILQIGFFSIGMDKAILGTLAIAIASLFFKIIYVNKFFLKFIILCFITPFIEQIINHTSYFVFIIIRRIFFIPAWITTFYYDFFKTHDKICFTTDVFVISKFLPDIYPEGVLKIIDLKYFQGKIPSPNTGMFAEAYMHIGILGIVVFPMLLILMLKWLDNITNYYSNKAKLVLSFSFSSLLISVPITGSYFVSSFIVLLLFTYLLNYGFKKLKIL